MKSDVIIADEASRFQFILLRRRIRWVEKSTSTPDRAETVAGQLSLYVAGYERR